MITITPQCLDCKHLHRTKKGPTCTAFPNGIPLTILLNEFDHRNPYPGDQGIRFEQRAPSHG